MGFAWRSGQSILLYLDLENVELKFSLNYIISYSKKHIDIKDQPISNILIDNIKDLKYYLAYKPSFKQVYKKQNR